MHIACILLSINALQNWINYLMAIFEHVVNYLVQHIDEDFVIGCEKINTANWWVDSNKLGTKHFTDKF